MARRVDDETIQYQGDFWPRDHGKSEIFCIAYPLRRICEDPDVRILLVQKTATEAEKTLSVIKLELEKNQGLKNYYSSHWARTAGDHDISNATGSIDRAGRKESAWQRRRIYVKRRRRGKDPTVEAVGVGGAITGGHFDIIILDDVEDDENTKTPERLQTLLDWFSGTIMQLREPNTKTIIVGTLKTTAPDIYNFILNNPSWNCKTVSAILSHHLSDIEYEPVLDDDGRPTDVTIHTSGVQVLWPSKWSLKALLLEMLASIRSIWIREKLNDLTALAGSIFKREWFSYLPRDQFPHTFTQIIQVWDTAYKEKETSDWTACLTLGLLLPHVYLLDLHRARLEFPALIPAIKNQYTRWRPAEVLIEDKASGQSALQVLHQETLIPLVTVSPAGRDKIARARAVTPFYQGARVIHPESAPWLGDFEDELTMFPDAANDDQVDVLVYGLLHLLAHGIKQIQSETIDDFGGYGGDQTRISESRIHGVPL